MTAWNTHFNKCGCEWTNLRWNVWKLFQQLSKPLKYKKKKECSAGNNSVYFRGAVKTPVNIDSLLQVIIKSRFQFLSAWKEMKRLKGAITSLSSCTEQKKQQHINGLESNGKNDIFWKKCSQIFYNIITFAMSHTHGSHASATWTLNLLPSKTASNF